MAEIATSHGHVEDEGTRRDFLYLLTGATVGVGTAVLVWPLIDSMNPTADVLALASTEVDLSGVEEGMRITVTWRGKPVFVDHRTQKEIEEARAVPLDELRDPQAGRGAGDRATVADRGGRMHAPRLRAPWPEDR